MKKERILLGLGLVLIGAGLFFNQYVFGWLFRAVSRPITGQLNLLIIWTFEFISIVLGLLFVFKRKSLTGEMLGRWYKFLSTNTFSAVLIFIVLNVLTYSVRIAQLSLGGSSEINPIAKKYGISLESLYPGLDQQQIGQLLQENWSRKPLYEPFVEHKERPIQGTYVNVDAAGFFRHVAEQTPWPPDPNNFNVFVFGGSTTFGYGVADKDTIASYLQRFLRSSFPGKKIAIYNFGTAAYYSSQERVRFERLLLQGYSPPRAAIFIDGVNDSGLAKVNDDAFFSAELASLFNADIRTDIIGKLPLVDFLNSYLHPPKGSASGTAQAADLGKIARTIDRYVINKKMIESVAQEFGVKTFFVWQPAPLYKYDLSYDPFLTGTGPTMDSAVVYPAMAEYLETHNIGDNFLSLADMQEGVKKALYVDSIHYSPEMSKEIAKRISGFIKSGITD